MTNRHLRLSTTANLQTTIEIPYRTNSNRSKRAIPQSVVLVLAKSTGSTRLSSLDEMALHYVFALTFADGRHVQHR